MNTLNRYRVHRSSIGRIGLGLLLLAGLMGAQIANANLIIRNGATMSITDSSILDVNCNDITIDAGGTLNLSSSTIENVLNFNQAVGSTFNNTGGTVETCRPQFTKQFLPNTIAIGATSTLTFTLENLSSVSVTDLAFTDTLDEVVPLDEVIIATPSNASTTCTNGNVLAADGGSTITFNSGELAASSSCTVSVDVTSSVAGMHPNTTSVLSSSVGTNDPASAELVVQAAVSGIPPNFSMAFQPDTIGSGGISTLTYTINNSSSINPVSGLSFSNNLPASVTVASPANIATDCDAGVNGSITATVGGSVITLSDYQLGGLQSCTFSVNVTSSTIGTHTNDAVMLDSSAGSTTSSPDDLSVETDLPSVSKSFAPSTVTVGDRSTLTFTIDNTANTNALISLSFVDTFPVGMVIAEPSNISNSCEGPSPTLTAEAGTGEVSFQAFGINFPGFEVLLAGATCVISLDVIATEAGQLDNVTEDVMFQNGGSFFTMSAGKASDTLTVTRTDLAIVQSFIDNPTPPGSVTTLEFGLTNSDRDFAATNIVFTNDLASTLAGLTFDSVVSNSCGGSLTGIGTTSIGFTGGTLAPEVACIIQVSLSIPANTVVGQYENTTSVVSGTVDGASVVGNMASEILFVQPVPLLTKTFVNDPVNPGGSVTLEFTVTNTSNTSSATDITFEDVFATVLPTASVTPGNDCVGAGSTCTFIPLFNPTPPCDPCDGIPARLTISGGTLAPAGMAGDSATFSITLDASEDAAPGEYENTTSEISAAVDGATYTGQGASDTLVVMGAPSLSKSFDDASVAPGDQVTLEFRLSHSPNAAGDATDITFTDDLATVLPGLTVNLPSTPDPACGVGSSLTGSAGDTLITLVGASLSPGQECTFSVTLDVPMGAAVGTYTNTSSGVSAMVDGLAVTSAPASADLVVAEPAEVLFTKEFIGDPALPGETVTLRYTLENNSPSDDLTITFFTDSLSSALSGLAATGAASVNTCGGALSGTTFLIYVGGTLLAGDSCAIEVDVVVPGGAADGSYTSTSSNLTVTQGGQPTVLSPAVDELVVNSTLLSLTKEFTDNQAVLAGSTTSLLFTITNTDTTRAASSISFTDNFDAVLPGLQISSIQGVSDCEAGGATIAGVGTPIFSVFNLSLAAGASCTVLTDMLVPAGADSGTYTNTTSELTGVIDGFAVKGTPASDEFAVVDLDLSFSKAFSATAVQAGDTTTLSFTITNNDVDDAVADLVFSDDLDAVVSGLVATGLPLNDVCGTGSVLSGTSLIALSGANLDANGGSCSFDVDLSIPITAAPGTFTNTTSELTMLGLLAAAPAIADLVIDPTPPVFSKTFTPDTVAAGVISTLRFNIDNSGSGVAVTALDFVDNLPAGLQIASPENISATCSGGTLTATSGASVISYTGGMVAANSMCSIAVDVVSLVGGTFVNISGDLTSSLGNSGAASDTLTVTATAPAFAKLFSPDAVAAGVVSTLIFSIDNSASAAAATAIDFTDNLPGGLQVASPANASTTCSGGTLTAVSGTSVINYTGGTAPANSTCTISADVVSLAGGVLVNTSGDLTSSLGNSGTASATLTSTVTIPLFSKSFTPVTVSSSEVSTLRFDIDNSGSFLAASALGFSDNLPNGLLVATSPNIVNTCGGVLTAAPGSGLISYSGGTVGVGATCIIQVDIATPLIGGVFINITSDLISSLGNSGSTTASLTVIDDNDDDSIPNDVDNCPNNANTDQADLDLDGLGNVCDSDADGDGMPNDYEIANGLDPLNSFDQRADPDGDGFTNLEEFQFGTDPNVADTDDDNNGIPDIVDLRRSIIPPIIFPLLLDDDI